MILTILYEDQTGVDLKEFGLHNLLLQCLCDDIAGIDLWQLKRRIQGHPKKGDTGVIRTMETVGQRLIHSGGLLALLDNDRIRRTLSLGSNDCKKIVADNLRSKAVGSDVILLVENTETLFRACEQLLGKSATTVKPPPDERDYIFNKMAHLPTPEHRKRLREVNPSFDRLVEKSKDWYLRFETHL